ncbi:LOB domain-containing protein 4-like [Tripterygium wilfordii]|uniref:LOB domain-containing protein 4-like n=1 Tax=Tripterygium wilfordii TaxID=458696 RepID=A0A7J7CQF9_TRIWF|nr:LOB domain-containing protein 4-like [Tripterygium wilfordii]
MKESGRKQGAPSPCAACKLLRRRCAQDCVFPPYFPADEPHKFANVHKVFGASNVNKMLQELPVHQRGDAVSSMVYEANARIRDPVYGCRVQTATFPHHGLMGSYGKSIFEMDFVDQANLGDSMWS